MGKARHQGFLLGRDSSTAGARILAPWAEDAEDSGGPCNRRKLDASDTFFDDSDTRVALGHLGQKWISLM